ncbi:hypothetical protein [Herbiconiux daphne]|uniref:Uncharacterized protein n=1 Tax=Herbiconiux daphne TaxID=2970914 RepID=A0ABT2H9B2_9MICO|nr:hypothetical protein [Herbiconiux daphne]MCS5736478.1 hypothetical protein [Herbiconiux daphne]
MNLNISIDEQQEFIAEVGEFIKLTKDKYRAGLVYEVVGKRQHRRKILYDVRRPFKRVEGIKYAETYEEPQYIGGVLGST